MDGLRVHNEITSGPQFPGVLESTIRRLASSFWLIDVQSGPWKITEKANFSELDAEIDRYLVRVPELEDTSSALWRPGIFPRFEELLRLDEWTYLTCLQRPEVDAVNAAKELFRAGYLSLRFFDVAQSNGATFLLFAGGAWEVYSTDNGLLDEIKTRKNASPTQSDKWLQSPYKG